MVTGACFTADIDFRYRRTHCKHATSPPGEAMRSVTTDGRAISLETQGALEARYT